MSHLWLASVEELLMILLETISIHGIMVLPLG